MVDHSDAEPRYFPDIVDKIVDPWRDPARDVPDGRVVVVAGTPQSGRTTVLGQVAADLRQAGVRVVGREVRLGALQTVDDAPCGERLLQGSTVLAAALQVAGAGAVGDLIALGAEIVATHRLADGLDPERPSSDPYVHVRRVAEAVRWQAEQEPLALVIDDADKLDHPDVWWDALFGTSLPRLAARLPVLVVLGVERTSTAASHALQVVDTKLLPAGLAEEIRLPALDPARIAAALGPIDDVLLGQLRSLVYGRPAWLDELWGEWRTQGIVVHRDGRWTAAPDARDRVGTSLHGWIESRLHADAPGGDAFWRAKEILETAALEGWRFTVEALAAVLGDDVEDLIDWIDDHLTDPDGPALLEEDGFVARADGVDPPELRCYRFRSAMVAGVLRKEVLEATNGKVLAGRYARALADAYRWSSVSDVAWTISRLATTAGDEELAEYVWRRANRLGGLEAAARLARFLVEHLDIDTASAEELAATIKRLNGLTSKLVSEWNAAETLEFCHGALRAARVVTNAEQYGRVDVRRIGLLFDALLNIGIAGRNAGEADRAVAWLSEAAELSKGATDFVRTGRAYRLLANAEAVGWRGDLERRASARVHIATALEYTRRGKSRSALLEQVSCLEVIAQLASTTEDRLEKMDAIRQSATLLLDPVFRHALGGVGKNVGSCLVDAAWLARIESQQAARERFYVASLRCRSNVSDHSTSLSNLSFVRWQNDDVSGAVRVACQALRLDQSYSAEHEGVSLLRLANCARSLSAPRGDEFAVLAYGRIERSVLYFDAAGELHRKFDDILALVDDATRQQIEHDYLADRGARLLREAFGVDVAEIDALNERLGDAGEDELRGFLLDVQRYCTR